MARSTKPHKVQAQYRLPISLFKRVKKRAADENLRPCILVERLLETGLNQQPPAEPDDCPAPEPAAAS